MSRSQVILIVLAFLMLAPFIVGGIYRFSGYWVTYDACDRDNFETFEPYDECRRDLGYTDTIEDVLRTYNIVVSILGFVQIIALMAFIHLISPKQPNKGFVLRVVAVIVVAIIVANVFQILLFGPPSGAVLGPDAFQ